MSNKLDAILRLTKVAVQSKNFNEENLIDFLEAHFEWVKKEGNSLGIFFYDETAYNTRKETPTYFVSFDKKAVLEFEIEETFYRYYAGTDIVDSSVDIFSCEYEGETLYANCDWDNSVLYFDDNNYPDWIEEEFEEEEEDEEEDEDE